MNLQLQIAKAAFFFGLTGECISATLADFTKCISAQGQGAVCQLDPGNYSLSLPLVIGRGNITIKGTIVASLGDTTLRRAPGSSRGLLASYAGSPPFNAITVRDFTFDGARDQQTGTSIESDVRFISVNSVLISNAAFINSPNIALNLEGSPGNAPTAGVVLNNILIDNAAMLGVLAQAYGGGTSTPGKYLTCNSFVYPSNLKITNSSFKNVGANALALEARDIQIIGNTLQHNHDTAPYKSPGGQIYIEICSDSVAMLNNTVNDGPATANGYFADGLELHGTNLVVVDNTIAKNAGSGIAMSGVQEVFIANWTSGTGVDSNNLTAGNGGGISLYNAALGDVNERQVDSVTIDRAVSTNGRLAGVAVFLQTGQTTPINHFILTNSCLAGNVGGPTRLTGLSSDAVVANNLSSKCPQ